MLSRTIILGLALPLCSSNMTLSVTADQQSPTSATGAQFTVTPAAVPTPSATQVQAPSTAAPGSAGFAVGAPIGDVPSGVGPVLDWHLHLNVDGFTDEKTLIASTEYPIGGHTIRITFSCVQKRVILPLGPRPGSVLKDHVQLPVYIEVSRSNYASDNSCKNVGFLKSATIKYHVSESIEYRIDDSYISPAPDASTYCNVAKLVFGSNLDAGVSNIKDLLNMEYSEIRSARRLRIRIKDHTDTNFDLDIDMSFSHFNQRGA
jgi:hypothetical protein